MKAFHFPVAAVIAISIVAGHPASAQEKLRDKDSVIDANFAEFRSAQAELNAIIKDKAIYGDEGVRKEVAPKALAPLRRMRDTSHAIQVHTDAKGRYYDTDIMAMLAYFGDAEAAAQLKTDSKSTIEVEAIGAQLGMIFPDWWTKAHDAAGQRKLVDELTALAKAHPNSDQITSAIIKLRETAAAGDIRDALMSVISDNLKGQFAQQVAAQLTAEKNLREAVGKPFVISGVALDGSNFSTADWKGKVVLVDFWATWCGPCKEELPGVKKAYTDYHPKGLEIVGVSCDQGAGSLKSFLQKNPDMPWPQLFDPSKPGWHEIATRLGVKGIPAMLLIDRAGILRSTDARGNLDQEIPKLLDEKAPVK